MIPDIVKEHVLEIVAKRFEESDARVICGGIYGGDIAFEYILLAEKEGGGSCAALIMRKRCILRPIRFSQKLK